MLRIKTLPKKIPVTTFWFKYRYLGLNLPMKLLVDFD